MQLCCIGMRSWGDAHSAFHEIGRLMRMVMASPTCSTPSSPPAPRGIGFRQVLDEHAQHVVEKREAA